MDQTREGMFAPPAAAELAGTLRRRYRELWEDVQREMTKHGEQRYSELVQQAEPEEIAVADVLIDLNIAEVTRDVNEMRAVHAALERVRRGTYGTCAKCGEEIPLERLRAVPHAALCVECQERVERRRSGDGTPTL